MSPPSGGDSAGIPLGWDVPVQTHSVWNSTSKQSPNQTETPKAKRWLLGEVLVEKLRIKQDRGSRLVPQPVSVMGMGLDRRTSSPLLPQ